MFIPKDFANDFKKAIDDSVVFDSDDDFFDEVSSSNINETISSSIPEPTEEFVVSYCKEIFNSLLKLPLNRGAVGQEVDSSKKEVFIEQDVFINISSKIIYIDELCRSNKLYIYKELVTPLVKQIIFQTIDVYKKSCESLDDDVFKDAYLFKIQWYKDHPSEAWGIFSSLLNAQDKSYCRPKANKIEMSAFVKMTLIWDKFYNAETFEQL